MFVNNEPSPENFVAFKVFVLGLYLTPASTRIGLLPLLAPTKVTNWSASVESKFVPTLFAFATLVVFASIHTVSVPSEDNN